MILLINEQDCSPIFHVPFHLHFKAVFLVESLVFIFVALVNVVNKSDKLIVDID